MTIMVQQGHLGGYVKGGDDATYYPDLWDWTITELGVASILDVGCGEGHTIDHYASRGVYAAGIDGVPQTNERVYTHDYTIGPCDRFSMRPFDMVWSCEFVEHVAEQHLPNFVDDLCRAPLVMLTHAEPGQPGYHHVNCRTPDYWAGVMATRGYTLNHKLTVAARAQAARNPSPWNHFKRSGLVFRRSA